MKNLKLVIKFSVFGFVLSFLFGLFSKPFVFFHTLFLALIFAIVFAGLGLGIQILMDKVLDINSSDEGFSSSGSAGPSAQTAGRSVGQNVNIVIEDQDIPQTEEESDFFVGTNHQMLNDSDINSDEKNQSENREGEIKNSARLAVEKASEPVFKPQGLVQSANNILTTEKDSSSSVKEQIASQNSSSSGFVPISLGENPGNISGTEAVHINEVKTNSPSDDEGSSSNTAAGQDSDASELDVLPDMDEITAAGQKKTSEDSEELPSDDEAFTPSGSSKDASEVTEGKDAALMAKAISTLLSQDK